MSNTFGAAHRWVRVPRGVPLAVALLLLASGCADDDRVAADERVSDTDQPAPPNFALSVSAATPSVATLRFDLEFILAGEPISASTGEVDLATGSGRSTDVIRTGGEDTTVEVILADGEMTERDVETGGTRPVGGGSVPDLLKVPSVGGADDADDLTGAIAILLGSFSLSEAIDDGEAPDGWTRYKGSQSDSEDVLEVWVDEDGRLTRFVYKTESADGLEATEILELDYMDAEAP